MAPSESDAPIESTHSHQPAKKSKAKAVVQSPNNEKQTAPNLEDEEELAITKEAKGTGKRSLQQMVISGRRRSCSRLAQLWSRVQLLLVAASFPL